VVKFLFVSSNPGPGASEILWTSTAAELVRRGHRVFALAPWPTSPPLNPRLKSLHEARVSFESLNQSPLGIPVPHVSPVRFWSINLRRALSRYRPDLTILSNGSWSDAVHLLPTITESELRLATLDHGIFEISWPSGPEIDVLQPAYSAALATFFVSDSSRRLAECQLGIDLARWEIARNPYAVSYDATPSWPSTDDCFALANVARLQPRTKGQDLLIDLLALPKWQQRPIRITCFGTGAHRNALIRESQRRGCGDKLVFAGHVDDIESIWASHHALIMPSRAENMPLATVEAMMCGRLPIVTDVGGHREIIEDHVSGFLAESATVAALDRTLEVAWKERDNWQRIGSNSARRIRDIMPRHPENLFADKLEQKALH